MSAVFVQLPVGIAVLGGREHRVAVLLTLQLRDLSVSGFWSSFQTVSFSAVLYLQGSSWLKRQQTAFQYSKVAVLLDASLTGKLLSSRCLRLE